MVDKFDKAPIVSFRREALLRLDALKVPDVLIIGAGVNGVATARDLALNGISVVLIDENDFCSGASGASSRLAHGGLRYLEGREFRLVAESTRERNLLLRHAPHLVQPLEIVVPVASISTGLLRAVCRFLGFTKRPGPMSLAALKGGLAIYEVLGSVERALPRHRTSMRREAFPKGIAAGTRAIVSYFDGQITNPEGLVMEMVGEASAACVHTAILNHIAWSVAEDGTFSVRDRMAEGHTWTIRPKIVINAAGAWIDAVNARLGMRTDHIRGVKGAHVVLRNDKLRTRMAGRAFYFHDGSNRMVIALPVGETILFGTTEVETREPSDRSVADHEIDYLIQCICRLFPDIPISPGDVIAVTTGTRPLQSGGGADATSAARDHALAEDLLPGAINIPVISMIGGKWTTFRSFAESTADVVLEHLGRSRTVSTRNRKYPGAASPEAERLAQACGLDQRRAGVLIARYGGIAVDVGRYCAAGPDRSLAGAVDYSEREIEWLILRRAALTLEDLVLRRTALVFSGRIARATLEDMGQILARTLDRDGQWAANQIEAAATDPRIMPPSLFAGRNAA